MIHNGSLNQSIKVILSVCLVCSLLVSTAAVMLHDRQKENQRQERIKNILIAANLYRHDINIERVYKQRIEPILINLRSGEQVVEDNISADFSIDDFDIQTFANDLELGENVDSEVDIAKIQRRPKYMLIYVAKTAGHEDKLILPVFGKGLWSTLYGVLSLDNDLQTITGITFYQHGETPGLGGEVDNPRWKQQCHCKKAFDNQGRVIIEVLRGKVNMGSADANHQIDGLAGATLTSRGVNHLLNYWLGEQGYGPLLSRLRKEWSLVSPIKAKQG